MNPDTEMKMRALESTVSALENTVLSLGGALSSLQTIVQQLAVEMNEVRDHAKRIDDTAGAKVLELRASIEALSIQRWNPEARRKGSNPPPSGPRPSPPPNPPIPPASRPSE